MSEDSFIITQDDNTNFKPLINLYESYQKLKTEMSMLRKQNFEFQEELVHQRNLNTIVDRKFQRALQDIEHYKMKNIIDNSALDLKQNNIIEVDYAQIYAINEENIEKQLSTEIKNLELTRQLNDLETVKLELENQIVDHQIKYETLQESYKELQHFLESKKTEMLEVNNLKLKIIELESALNSSDKSDYSIYLSMSKIDELQIKCFKLEKENKKYRENHTNLLLLVEENTSLISKIDRLQQQLLQCNSQVIAQSTDRSELTHRFVDESMTRKCRHLEKENEILKIEQTQILEKNSELMARVNALQGDMLTLKERNDMLQGLVQQKSDQLDLIRYDMAFVARERDSYKTVLDQFTDPRVGDEAGTTQLSSRMVELCCSLDSHNEAMRHQMDKLDRMTEKAELRLNMLNSGVAGTMEHRPELPLDELISNRNMVIELRQQVEQLQEDLDNKNQLLDKLQKFANLEDVALDGSIDHSNRCYGEMGFCRDTSSNSDRSRNIFRKLTNELIEAIRKIFGFSVELGPNGYFTVQSCLDKDSSHFLEFKIQDEPVLVDNSYSLSIRNEIDFKDNFSVLLASLTLGLIEQQATCML